MTTIPSREEFFAARNRAIAEQFQNGVPLSEIAGEAHLGEATVLAIAYANGAKRPKRQRLLNKERDEAVATAYLAGKTLEELSQECGITRERIRQILVRDGHTDRHFGSMTERRIAAREKSIALAKRLAEERSAREAIQDARKQSVREMYTSGSTYKAISEALDIPISLVLNDVWATGGPARTKMAGKPRRKITDEDKAVMAQRYANGEHVRTIANDFSVSPEHVRATALSLGFKRRGEK